MWPHRVHHAPAHLAVSLAGDQTAPEWAQPKEVAVCVPKHPGPVCSCPQPVMLNRGPSPLPGYILSCQC